MAVLGETFILKIIMIDDITLLSKLKSLHGKSTRFYLFYFITDDMHDVSTRRVGEKVTF